jgi:hypothetical protein
MTPYFRAFLVFLAALAIGVSAFAAPPVKGEVARFEGGDVRVVLTSVPGQCPAPMKRFLSVAGKVPFMGCWMQVGQRVLMEADGEPDHGYFVPAENFTWAPLA